MSKISVDVSSARIPVLQVGYQGENEVTDVLFDISSWITEFGEGVAQLRVKRPGNSEDESYVLSLIITDGKAVWTVSETDTANKGNGKVQLSYMVGNILKKAVIYPYKVGKSIVGADSPVDPFDSWIERSKAWAIGKTLDGNDVPETDETYQNNAKYYAEQADILGTKWIDDNNAVIKAYNGAQLSPITPDSWLRRFCKKYNLRHVSIHSFRHFNATLLINAGVI